MILTHIIKLDLSKNQLRELPEDFGVMSQLKHLDLYSNQITHLPLSFSELRNLRWLDLKNNPLAPVVARVIGPCLDAAQCQAGARAAVQLYTEMRAQIEEERELRRQLEARQHEIQQEKERQTKKRNERKKAARQKKKEAHQQQVQEKQVENTTEQKQQRTVVNNTKKVEIKQKNSRGRRSFVSLLMLLVLAMLPLAFLASAGGLLGDWWDDNVLGGLSSGWQRCQQVLPEGIKPWAHSFIEIFIKLHSSAGHFVEDISATLDKLPHTNTTIEMLTQVLSAAANQSQIIFRTLSEKVLIITDEITKKLI